MWGTYCCYCNARVHGYIHVRLMQEKDREAVARFCLSLLGKIKSMMYNLDSFETKRPTLQSVVLTHTCELESSENVWNVS